MTKHKFQIFQLKSFAVFLSFSSLSPITNNKSNPLLKNTNSSVLLLRNRLHDYNEIITCQAHPGKIFSVIVGIFFIIKYFDLPN